MAYVDAQTLLWDAAALTASAVSTNTYDTLAATTDVTRGEELSLVITVDVAADFTTGNETYEFRVIQSAAANLGSATVLASRTILASALTAGSIHVLPLPAGSKTLRYLGADCVLAGTTPTITVTAWLTASDMAPVTPTYYPDAMTVS
jgi:hypothetical protein